MLHCIDRLLDEMLVIEHYEPITPFLASIHIKIDASLQGVLSDAFTALDGFYMFTWKVHGNQLKLIICEPLRITAIKTQNQIARYVSKLDIYV